MTNELREKKSMNLQPNCNLLLFMLAFSLLYTCKTERLMPGNTSSPYIIVGNGGGFTGMQTSYCLMKDGSVFQIGDNDTTFNFMFKISKDLTTQLFSSYDQLGFKNFQLNDPGNRYFYIEYKDRGINHKILWNSNSPNTKNLKIYHDLVMNVIKSNQEL